MSNCKTADWAPQKASWAPNPHGPPALRGLKGPSYATGPDPLEQSKLLPTAAAADRPRVGAMFLLMRGARHDCPLNMTYLPLSGLDQKRRAGTVYSFCSLEAPQAKHHLATGIRRCRVAVLWQINRPNKLPKAVKPGYQLIAPENFKDGKTHC